MVSGEGYPPGRDGRFETQFERSDPAIQALLRRVPELATSPLPSQWIRWEMLERLTVLDEVPIEVMGSVVEIGSGSHGLSTVPLAYRAGPRGRVIAIERERWANFRAVLEPSGLSERVSLVAADARQLPLRNDAADLAACVHGVRSLGADDSAIEVIREMLRVAGRALLVESLPLPTTNAQRAHLAMYGLRAEALRPTRSGPDDRSYRPLPDLARLVERAGGIVRERGTLDVDLPHPLGFFPRRLIEDLEPGDQREALLRRWDAARDLVSQYGEDHPPVGWLVLSRR